ncbi:hypothetical protein ACWOKN_004235 [Vibrio vulnificus]|nr:hypothetical protein [Vibrio vulnificus]
MNYIENYGYELEERIFTTSINLDQCQNHSNFFFCKAYIQNFSENDIKKIKSKIDGRDEELGFLIPSFSTVSNDHDYSSNSIFQRFADAGIKNFLENLEPDFLDLQEDESALEELLHENLGFLVISRDRFIENEQNKNKLFIELLKYSVFIDIFNKNDISIVDNSLFPAKALPETKAIKITLEGNKATNDQFIIDVFSQVLFKETNHLLQFFYLYQIIETLIEFVMKNEYTTVKEKIDALGDSITSQNLKSFVDTVNKSLKEINRINKLNSNYSQPYDNDFDTREKLNDFIKQHLDSTWDKDTHTSIYEIRNKSFHEFRSLGDSQKLATITPYVFGYVLHLVANYKSI